MHLLLIVLSLTAAKPATQKLTAALALEQKGVDPTVASTFDDLLVQTLGRADIGRVISPQDVVAMLNLAEKQQLAGCDTSKCMAEISQGLGAAFVVSGSLAKLGDDLLLSLSLINTRIGEVVARAQRRVPDGGDYASAVNECVSDLYQKRIAEVRTAEQPQFFPLKSASRAPAPARAVVAAPASRVVEGENPTRKNVVVAGVAIGAVGIAGLVSGAVMLVIRPGLEGIARNEYAALASAQTDVTAKTRALNAAVARSNALDAGGTVLIPIGITFAVAGAVLLAVSPAVKPQVNVTSSGGTIGVGGAW